MSIEMASSGVPPTESNMTRRLSLAISVLTILGMIDSGYLTIQHMRKAAVPCGLGNCEKVLTSPYAEYHGFPTSVFGFAFYASIFVLLGCDTPRWWIPALAGVGFLVHTYLVYVQAFILHAFCLYCLFSAGITTLLLIVSLLYVRSLYWPVEGLVVEGPDSESMSQ
jgi:uncharacterized membrane protein